MKGYLNYLKKTWYYKLAFIVVSAMYLEYLRKMGVF